MTDCDETVIVMNILSTKKINTITTNVTTTASINCQSKKVRDCSIFTYSFISDNITIDNYSWQQIIMQNERV